MRYEIDDIDRHIITLLQTDGRMSNVEIARRLKLSEGTIRNCWILGQSKSSHYPIRHGLGLRRRSS